MNNHGKAKPRYSTWGNCVFMLWTAWKKRPSLLWLCMLIAVTDVFLGMTQLFATPVILSAIESAVSTGKLISIIVFFAGLLILFKAADLYFSSCTQFKRIEIRLHLAAMIQDKILTMSFPHIENQDVRRKMDKALMLVNSNKAATEAIWGTSTDLFKNTAGFMICLSLLAILDPLLIIAALVTTVISFFIRNHLDGWEYRHRDEESEYSRRMNYLSEKSKDCTLAKDVRIFGMRGWMEDVYLSTLRLFNNFTLRKEKVYFMGDAADIAFTFMRNGMVYLILIGSVIKGELSAAQFVFFFNTVGAFTGGMGALFKDFSLLHKQSLDISAVREFLDYPEMFLFENGMPLTPNLDIPYQITLRNVSFRYPEAEMETLSHINLTIHAGEKLAVVGLNGAGKTTLIKLICGFLDPTEGAVLLNDTDIRNYNRRDYYRLFSAVFQDFSLLDVTIAENIAQSGKDINMERVKYCVDQAGLSTKIDNLPDRYNTHLGKVYEDGIELSGGEVQRLMLARALYKDAPVIVLDEPTAALDPIAESEIYDKYNDLTGGRTSLYISHRLASTQFCDRIILLANGSIVEEGTHESLIAQGGKYAELFEIQSQYYTDEC